MTRASHLPPLSSSSRRSLPRRKSLLIGIITLLLFWPASLPSLFGQRGRPTQYQVEAVYLYQFGKFVSWPSQPNPSDFFSICILGHDPFGEVLDDTITGERIGQTPLKVERLASAEEARHCRIVYISESESPQLTRILDTLRDSPILTVGEAPDFASRGGMIQFVIEDNKVRFEINLGTAQKAGLAMSSQLLKVAASVRGASGATVTP
jgi:hypothetical protein